MQKTAKFYSNLGFNVIPVVGKKAVGKWTQYQTVKQTGIDNLSWNNCTGLSGVNGVNDIHSIDFDNVTDCSVIDTALDLLSLPPDYSWLVRSGSGKGYHIWFRIAGDLPEPYREESAVWFYPRATGFDHLELRWQRCLTVLPPSLHSDTNQPYVYVNDDPIEAPVYVERAALFNLLEVLCDIERAHNQYSKPVPVEREVIETDDTRRSAIEQIKVRIAEQYAEIVETYMPETSIDYERNGEIRLLGNGGLLLNSETGAWHRFAIGQGGDPIDFIGYILHEDKDSWNTAIFRKDGKRLNEALKKASQITGIDIPAINKRITLRDAIRDITPEVSAALVWVCPEIS